ncbi:MAG: type II toxin-antitoxin system VapC family toxin [Epsilonproteobacteria bacterium]|nr:type II toxin-antitoxin system VapC family toxin [Campylobacterota bacterium]
MAKIFLDTNIVIDYIERTRPNHDKAVRILEMIAVKGWNICISEDMLTTIYYIARSKEKVLRFFQAIEEEWEILCFDGKVRKEAYKKALESGEDFEDLIQCLSALHHGCDYFLTSDRSFQNCGIEIVTYEDILE